MKFYKGTTSPYKVREVAGILRPLEIELCTTDPIDPEETGDTLEANAQIKVEAYGQYVGQKLIKQFVSEHGCSQEEARTFLKLNQTWVMCEDSGLFIPALNGLPGPWSARFDDCLIQDNRIVGHTTSGRTRDEIDTANNRRVLELMKGIEQPHRTASFGVCLMVADIDGTILFKTTSFAAGWILEGTRGRDGFGYDPIFASGSSFGKSWAEIDGMRKNLISHRRKALQHFTSWLASQLKGKD